jgi:small subunit ribosomal protein S10
MPEVGSRKIQGINDGEAPVETQGSEETKQADQAPKRPPPSDEHTSHRKTPVRVNKAANTDSLQAPAALPSTSGKAPIPVTAHPSEHDPNDLDPATVNVPPNVLAAFRTPLRHKPTHGIPVASLQMRSYSVRNLEFYADFAVRAAYWLGLPCSGPVPLPKKIERWTVPRSPFIFKKSMENFERITRRRLLTIYDGDPAVVEIWLAFLRKWQFYGVGMKANVWQFEGLGKTFLWMASVVEY